MKKIITSIVGWHEKQRSFLRTSLAVLGIASLIGCGGGGGGGGGGASGFSTVTVGGSLGQIRNAQVTLFDSDLVQIGDPVELDANGLARFDRPSGSGPFLFQIDGDFDAEYFDESTEDYEPFGPGQSLRAIIGSAQRNVGITLLTDIAVEQLSFEPGGLAAVTASRADAVNESIREIFLDGLDDITERPTIVGDDDDRLGEELEDIHAAMLAAYAELAEGGTAPALAILAQLREDMADGTFDSRLNGNPLVNEVVDLTNLQAELDTAFAEIVDEYGDSSLDVADLQAVRDGQLSGLWRAEFDGSVSLGRETERIPRTDLGIVPASEVPSLRNADLEDLEDELATELTFGLVQELPGAQLQDVDVDIRSEDLSEVEVRIRGEVFWPAEGVTFDFVIDIDFERVN